MARPGFEPSDDVPVTAGPREDGETRIRTGDTTIFSRVLYQLSYLALGLAMLAIRSR